MNMLDRTDPELVGPLQGFLEAMGGGPDLNDIPGTRARSAEIFAGLLAQAPVIPGVSAQDLKLPRGDGSAGVLLRIFRPDGAAGPLPVLLWMHGGGYVLGNIEQEDLSNRMLARDAGCAIAAVEYRLAPEHPFPAPLEDCYAALRWLWEEGPAHGLDRDRIAVGGASAGGGLAVALALLARDRGRIGLAFLMPYYPMIDDRNVAPAGGALQDTLLWTRESNRLGWRAYLNREPGAPEISPYAAPARADDLRGLPPVYLPVGELDLFLEENLALARRLIACGVPTELHVYPRAYHAFDMFAPEAAVSRRFAADRTLALRRVLGR